MTARIVLYTACFGDHDQPVDIPIGSFGPNVDLVCFTDSPILARSLPGWTVFRRRSRFRTSRMDAKWYKMSASHLFPEHGVSIYVDSSVRFHKTDGFVEHCLSHVAGHNRIAFFAHPEDPKRTIREEARFSMTMGKYAGEPIIDQAEHYYSAGYQDRELLAGGCIVRRHTKTEPYFEAIDQMLDDSPEDVSAFEKAWFDECVHWSVQDQVSLPYVLWKEGISYRVLPGSIYENEFFSRVWSGPGR